MSAKTLNGACLCGKVTYTIDLASSEPTPKLITCHCTSCKKYTGSAFSTNIIIHPSQLRYTSGEPKIFMDLSTDSGTPLPRTFCGDCGCHFTSSPTGADWAALKWGTLDEESRKKCGELGGEIYCKRRDSWLENLAEGKGEGVFKKEAGMG
ncbi:Mss4-like protein [Aspergillus nidulans var. acristatus]